ncbi:MAG: hypothetical protein GC155_14960 [Alphaproteobacteria bacterium]|nr:hypothetical protein [Alphaproteobacteria bacterium]
MKWAVRGLVGVAGVLAIIVALAFWANPAAPAERLGLTGEGGLGLATLRADLGGFFGGAGALALYAAIRDRARLLTAPLLLICLALAGRIVTVVVNGFEQSMIQPAAIEVVLLVVLAAGRTLLSRPQAEAA